MLQAVILAAGRSRRMRTAIPKVLHEAGGASLLSYCLETLQKLGVKKPVVVVGYGGEQVARSLNGHATLAWQRRQLGTAHAALQGLQALSNQRGTVLVTAGDVPLLQVDTLRRFYKAHRANHACASVLSATVSQPQGYGRIIRSQNNQLLAIREDTELDSREQQMREINTGTYLFDIATLRESAKQVKRNRQSQEFYLTDVIELLRSNGQLVNAHCFATEQETWGVNSRKDLLRVTHMAYNQQTDKHLAAGVTIIDPATTYIAPRVSIGQDTVVFPCTYIERGVRIGKRCKIGPFARLRDRVVIQDEAEIGSFVEIARSHIGKRTRIKHLSYIGDAQLGREVNVGAGTITANFDGKRKAKTVIGDRVFVGCDTIFIAPLTVGKNARTGAGAVVPKGHRVPAGVTVVGIPAQPLQSKQQRKDTTR